MWVLTVLADRYSSWAISGVGSAEGDGREHLALGQDGEAVGLVRPGCWQLDVVLDEPPGDAWGGHGLAGRDGADRGDQVRGERVLEEEAAGAGAQCLVHVLVQVEGCQDEDSRRVGGAGRRADSAGRFDAVDAGHPYVHDDHVWSGPVDHLDRAAAIRCLADDLDVLGLVEDDPEGGAHQFLVVDEHDADGRCGPSTPTRTLPIGWRP
jgi:hypothetical protein